MLQLRNSAAARGFKEEPIDLRHHWRVMMRHKWGILGLACALSLLTALVVMAIEPVYRSSVTILIESQSAKVVSIEQVYGLDGGNSEYYLTQFEILKSRELVERVVRKLDLRNHPEFDPELKSGLISFNWRDLLPLDKDDREPSEDDLIDDVVTAVQERLSVTPVRKTQLVNVSFESHDPVLAAAVANTMADLFIEGHLEAKLQATQKATEWLGGRIGALRSKLEESERRLQAYRDDEQLVDVAGVQTMSARELDEITGRLVEARKQRSQAESIYLDVKSLQGKSADELMTIPAVLSHPMTQGVAQQIAASKRKVAEYSKRYGAKHPKMIAAQSELESSEEALQTQVALVVSGLKRDYQSSRRTEQGLQSQLDTSKSAMQSINRKEFKLLELQREVETNRKLYDMFLTRIKETDEAGGLSTAHARVVDPAVVPRQPVYPRKTLAVVLAFVASLLLGLLVAFLLDALDNTLKTPLDVEEKLSAPMLGIMPLVKTGKSGDLAEYWHDPKSGFAEAIRTIRTGVLLSNLDQPQQVTVVTSSIPSEGKSTVSMNLAVALGQMETTLVIGADLRRPTLASRMGLQKNAPGLAQLVAGTNDIDECIHRWEDGGVDVMPAGIIPSNPLEVLSSKRFVAALASLKERYARIIIDSAPTHAVSDAMVLASYSDSLIYVVKADSTPFNLARSGIARLVNSNAPFTGVVLNQVDLEKAPRYSGDSSYYYSGYRDAYGYGDAPQSV